MPSSKEIMEGMASASDSASKAPAQPASQGSCPTCNGPMENDGDSDDKKSIAKRIGFPE